MERRGRRDKGISVVKEKYGGILWREIWRREYVLGTEKDVCVMRLS